MKITQPPIVLVLAGNDPSGGAGLCADIQALASQGCHAAPVITCITIQDTCNVLEKIPLSGETVVAQADAILNDIPIAVCKIGLLGSIDIVKAIQSLLLKYPHIPVILDPILAAGGGQTLMQGDTIITHLLPLTYIITPNSLECRTLVPQAKSLDEAALQLIAYGCEYVCITGTHENTSLVINTLYGQGHKIESWSWPRLPHSYHGSGCTFSASLAGLIAQGKDIRTAVYHAQQYTWQSLQHGFLPGQGQALPNRLPKKRKY